MNCQYLMYGNSIFIKVLIWCTKYWKVHHRKKVLFEILLVRIELHLRTYAWRAKQIKTITCCLLTWVYQLASRVELVFVFPLTPETALLLFLI